MQVAEKLLARLTAIVGGAVLVLMMIQISLDVALRNLFDSPLPGTVEAVSHYYMVAVSFLPIAYAQIRRRHIEASILVDQLPAWAQRLSDYLALALGLAVYAALTYQTTLEAVKQTARRSFVEAGTILFPIWPGYWLLPVSFALMAAVLVLQLFHPSAYASAGAADDLPQEDG